MQAPLLQTAALSVRRLALGLPLLLALGACGYKGPLYMPPPPAPDDSLVAPPTSGAVPPASGAIPPASADSGSGTPSTQTIPVK
jgi:predicted small lipoprotein YifL